MHPDLVEYGPVRFHSDPNALYDRHLLFDYAIDPDLATPRDCVLRFPSVFLSFGNALRRKEPRVPDLAALAFAEGDGEPKAC